MSGQRHDLLVVGGGPAGLSAARAYRAAGGAGRVGIVTDERRLAYSRPALSKELLRGEIAETELALEPDTWLAEQRVDLVAGRAVSLDPQAREVTLSGGRTLSYGTCVLATGAEPTRLPVPGGDDPGVRTLRSLEDVRELSVRRTGGIAVAVIGAGFIGCEIAASLRTLGHPVTIVAAESAPNVSRLGPEAAATIASWLQEAGVELRLGAPLQAIERAGSRLGVVTSEGSVTSELVVMATGVTPRSELAALAGLELADGAIPADAAMRTTTDGVLAAGDVCRAENAAAGRPIRVEHWGDALGQGEVAGRTAAGAPASWDDAPGFWSTIGGRTLKYAGWGDGYDQLRWAPGADGSFVAWYGRDGRVAGVLAHDDDAAYDRGRDLIRERAPW